MTILSMMMMMAMKGWCKDRRAAPPWKVPGLLLTLLIGTNGNVEDDKFLRKGVKRSLPAPVQCAVQKFHVQG